MGSLSDTQTDYLIVLDEHAFTRNSLRLIPLSSQSYRHAFGVNLKLFRGFDLI